MQADNASAGIEGSAGSPDGRTTRRFLFSPEKNSAQLRAGIYNVSFCLANTWDEDLELNPFYQVENYTAPDCQMAPNCTVERHKMENTRLWCDFHYMGAIGQVGLFPYILYSPYFENHGNY